MKYQVLIVDDSLLILEQLREILVTNDYVPIPAKNVMEAMKILKEKNPHIIITDIEMPKLSGIQFIEWLRSHEKFHQIPILVLSSHSSKEKTRQCLKAGADDFIPKPIHEVEIMSRLNGVCRLLKAKDEYIKKNEELERAFEIIEKAHEDSLTISRGIQSEKDQIDNELTTLGEVQKKLLKKEFPHLDSWEFASFYQPSGKASGDYYDLIRVSRDLYGLAIADVSGHGAYAAAIMAMLNVIMNEMTSDMTDPANALKRINDILFKYTLDDQFITMFYGILNIRSGELTYSVAGHHPPYLYSAKDMLLSPLSSSPSYPLSLFPKGEFINNTITIEKENTLVLFTDGIIEVKDDQRNLYGDNRFIENLRKNLEQKFQLAIPGIIHEIEAFRGKKNFNDDLTLFLIKRTGK